MTSQELNQILKTKNTYRGLTQSEASSRLAEFGRNVRPAKKKVHPFIKFLKTFAEPMMFMIVMTGIVYFFIGDKIQGFVFFLSIIPIGLMSYFQERRTDRAVAELDKALQETCKVFRDKKIVTIDVKDITRGDLIYLAAGDKIPADGYILSGNGIMIDESILTGESASISKIAIPDGVASMTDEYKLFQGTLVTQGSAEFLAVYTGAETEYNRLGALLEKIDKDKTPLQKKIAKLIKGVATIAIITAFSVAILLTMKYGVKDGLLGGLTMGMSLIPEEFPIVFSVFLIMGVWRMSRKNALAREMAMVETLGSATVICTDKTGTLTEGRLSLVKVFYKGKIFEIKKDEIINEFAPLIYQGVLALERIASDPLETETQRYAQKFGLNLDEYFNQYDLIKDGSFDARTKMVHHIWRDKSHGQILQYTVGAPEFVIEACVMTAEAKKSALKIYEDMAADGLRIIAVATASSAEHSEISLHGLDFVGLLAMSDPPRARVDEAVRMCQEAGIRVMMITGDNKLTAHSIAEQIGIKHNDEVLSGDELAKLSSSALCQAVKVHDIFARIRPEQKYLIVEALKQNGEVVAMTGDGVNDAPALKKADIGIAMGLKGTEVARAAAGMILLDDNFYTIARAVKEGRKIYRNMQQAFAFLLTFHMPIVFIAIFPLLFGEPLIFLPIHIIFLELICDPVSVLGFEKEKAPRDVMRVPPRPAKESLIPPALWGNVLMRAIAITILCLGFYWYFSRVQGDATLGRAMAFITLIISQALIVVFSRDSFQIKNNYLLTAISIATLFAAAVICFAPFLNSLFRLSAITFNTFALSFGACFAVMGLAAIAGRLFFRK
ncbi:MAG: cation-translocating P-type ATPase [Patescibacteria group bacterium]